MKVTLFTELSNLPLTTIITLIIAALMIVALVFVFVRAKKNAQDIREQQSATRALVYGALCVALSFLLSYLKLFEMPQGGSITVCSMLPIALYANWFGTRNGLIAAFACGILQFIQKPIAMHWLSPFLDYVLAFTCFGLAGLFPKSVLTGLLVGGIGRIFFSTISGAVFFAEYAPAGMNPWIYSIIYNTISLGPDVLICMAVAAIPGVKRALKALAPVRRDAAAANV